MKKPNNVEEIYIDGIHEYNYVKIISKDATIHTLYYSDYMAWVESIRGKKTIEIIDTGDGIRINDLLLDGEISYLRIEQLHIILRLYSQECTYEISQPNPKREF